MVARVALEQSARRLRYASAVMEVIAGYRETVVHDLTALMVGTQTSSSLCLQQGVHEGDKGGRDGDVGDREMGV